jgi:parallel beta-helix repeat protein
MQIISLLRKGLVVGIILLFIGTCIIPAIAQDIEKPSLPTSRGHWLYVGGSGPGNYTQIQDAIDNASSGDTVFVYAGIYQEWINIEKALTLQGQGKETTYLDATNNNDRLVVINASFVTIDGFTLENCYNPSEPGFCQAIWIKRTPYSENIRISNCIMTHNDKGIYFENMVNFILINCTFEHNPAQGLWGFNSTNISIKNCYFNDNGHNMGGGWFVPGGITLEECSQIDIQNCQFSANTGWGIEINNGGNVTIKDNSIRSSSWYGIYTQYINGLQIINNIISSNTYMGVLINLPAEGNIMIYGNNISSNGHGQHDLSCGGISLSSNTTNISVSNNTFYQNNIVGLIVDSPHSQITSNTFIGNKEGLQVGYLGTFSVVCDNWFGDNSQTGVYIGADYGHITHNTIHGSETGVYLTGFGILVSHNLISNVKWGVLTVSSWHNISSNTIANASDCCVSVNGSGNMVISSNNFLNYSKDPYLYRYYEPRNHWDGNYWGKPRLLPKIIFGTQLYYLTKKFSRLTLPAIEIDWQPAQEPYDIPGMG